MIIRAMILGIMLTYSVQAETPSLLTEGGTSHSLVPMKKPSVEKTVRHKFPWVEPYPLGLDPESKTPVPVARQHEEDGSYADLYIWGHVKYYNSGGDYIGRSGQGGPACRKSKGLPPNPHVALALMYQKKYRDEAILKCRKGR